MGPVDMLVRIGNVVRVHGDGAGLTELGGHSIFRRMFRAVCGSPPRQFVMDACFRQAKAFLATTDTPAARIAGMSGSKNAYAFRSAFHLHDGLSLTDCRKNDRE